MSAKTDDATQSIQNIIAKGMPHKDEMYAVQGYCDMLTKEIAELEAERDAWKATAERMANSFLRVAGRCHFCTHRHNDCADYDCFEVTDKTVLTRFGAPEEDE